MGSWVGLGNCMTIEAPDPEISLRDEHTEIVFLWSDFDGDDCFNNHKVLVRHSGQETEYDLGPCVVSGPRKLTRLVEGDEDNSIGFGFRNPDIITYDLKRTSTSYEFTLIRDAQNLNTRVTLVNPQIRVNREFLDQYDGDR